ncbi:MAG: hypothetical protein KJO35_00820 [Gammaproteobacteria bacterium]|nr:hypothetical protein [Gammaproteobacteria bacterium]
MTIIVRTCLVVLTAVACAHWSLAQDTWDSDEDGMDDNIDNCTLVANPDQLDVDGDYKGNLCDADFNNDNATNALDLGIMRSNFFTTNPLTDIDGDGITNVTDLGLLKSMFFATPGPTAADPQQPPCTCYFGGDCPSGMFCDYGPGGFTAEDICAWRNVKPNGVVGAGCYIESNLTTGEWVADICDGVCVGFQRGSSIGLENQALVTQTIAYWGVAMLDPSAAGGGPVDPQMAAQAMAVPFTVADVPLVLGRQTADALAMAAGEPFHEYFCHYEAYPEDKDPPVVDLAGDTCRITSGQLTVQALIAAIQTPGSAAGIMRNITDACPDWQNMFATQCAAGPGALKCAVNFIEQQAQFLRTPPLASPAAQDPVQLLLSKTRR